MTIEAITESLQQHRGFLKGLAYRMLGEVGEAEDVVQDAYLRCDYAAPRELVDSKAYLAKIVTRLCLDRLKAARHRRETYVGAWLPEPLVEEYALTVTAEADSIEDVSYALMLAMERLSPLERAAFILHDVFDMDFQEVGSALDRSESSCRKLASRARAQIKKNKPRFAIKPDEGRRLREAFFSASRNGDTCRLSELLAESAILHSDGGGRKPATLRPIFGVDKIGKLFRGLSRKYGQQAPLWHRNLTINKLPGYATVESDGTLQAVVLEHSEGCITAVYIIRNPEKLQHLLPLVPERFWPKVSL